jgi:putative ABC transport system substrate-binding protein
MTRREVITLLGGTATVWPLAVLAQESAVPVIGFLSARSPAESAVDLAAFRQGLGQTGYFEGKNVAIEYRWAEGRFDRLPALAADLVARKVAVIAAVGGEPSGLAAKAATAEIPIVCSLGGDPVVAGLVTQINRPDGNVTGVSIIGQEMGPKRVELARDLVPEAREISALINPKFHLGVSEARTCRLRRAPWVCSSPCWTPALKAKSMKLSQCSPGVKSMFCLSTRTLFCSAGESKSYGWPRITMFQRSIFCAISSMLGD